MGRMKKRKAESGKRERRGDPRGRPGARRTDCHSQCAHRLRNDGLFARGTVKRRDTWVPPYTALFCRGGRPCPPGSARSLWCVGEGLSCPPSCQPIPGHCRSRQSGHFLETGSLHPPLAALRRFPLPRATARVAPTERFVGADDPVRPMWVCNIFVGQGPCALPVRGGIPQSRLRRASPL